MSFQRVDINSQTSRIFINGDEVEATPVSLSTKIARFLVTLLTFLVLAYGAVFYLPAYFNVGQALGISKTPTGSLPPISQLEANTNAAKVKIRKGYIRAGQGLKLDYSLSPGTTMNVELARCSAPIFVNAFNCIPTDSTPISVDNTGFGAKSFFLRQSGFYSYREYVTDADGTPSTSPYVVKWTRKSAKRNTAK